MPILEGASYSNVSHDTCHDNNTDVYVKLKGKKVMHLGHLHDSGNNLTQNEYTSFFTKTSALTHCPIWSTSIACLQCY